MDPFCGDALKIAGGLATVIVSRAVAKNSLSPSGALAAWVVAFLSVGCGFRGFLILIFYQVSYLLSWINYFHHLFLIC